MFNLTTGRHLISRLRKDRRGTAAIEFAFVILPIAALLLGTVQLGVIFFANQTLDEAVFRAAREIKTGNSQTVTTAELRSSICRNVFFVPDCEDNLDVTVQTFDTLADVQAAELFDSRGFPNINNTIESSGANDVIVVGAAVDIPIVFAPVTPSLSDESDRSSSSENSQRLFAHMIFQNENFD